MGVVDCKWLHLREPDETFRQETKVTKCCTVAAKNITTAPSPVKFLRITHTGKDINIGKAILFPNLLLDDPALAIYEHLKIPEHRIS